MSRRYYRKRYYKNNNSRRKTVKNSEVLAKLFLWLFFWPICLLVVLIKSFGKKQGAEKCPENPNNVNQIQQPTQPTYTQKDSIMTECEREYFNAIRNIVGNSYIVQPQINLASIVSKEQARYQNELFRNIDFGVFDKNYSLKLLIEINDKTHEEPERIERDKKVRQICEKAGIPLIAFWTKYGIDLKYIEKRLRNYLTF